MEISSSGNVAIGTTPSSTMKMTVNGVTRITGLSHMGAVFDPTAYASAAQFVGNSSGTALTSYIRSGNYVLVMGYRTNSNSFVIAQGNTNGNGVRLNSFANGWSSNSDERLKIIHGEITGVLDTIANIRCVRYNYKNDGDENPFGTKYNKQRIGFIAQDILPNYPEAVDIDSNADDELSLCYQDMIPVTFAGLKELHAEVKTLKATVAQLQQQVASLMAN